MPKYIDADALKELFADSAALCNDIDEFPAADVRENRHGRWIKQNPLVDTEECSLCGYNVIDEEFETPFCPWCGADMRGEDRETDLRRRT